MLRDPDDGAMRARVAANAAQLGLRLLDATSNDYLGLAQRSVSRETLGKAGAAASRLIHGTTDEHLRLETALAAWVGAETALLFSSTYSANLGLIAALGIQGSLVISDAFNHASLIDGARLAKAEVAVVPHLDLEAIRLLLRNRQSPCWVVTESYFSMDGDGPDLGALRSLCDSYGACLIVDEAHALGVFGPAGAGRCAQVGVRPDVLVGALGKAVGTHGGFVAGPKLLRDYLWNRARSFVFSTAPSPAHAALTEHQLRLAQQADALRAKLDSNAAHLRARLTQAGLKLIQGSFGPIISVVVGENARAIAVADRLHRVGILAQAIRPPTVPEGTARLRLTVKATFADDEIDRLADAVEDACRAS
ncbi:MAG TPA: 8-amino-7-oxononanoate synthase [Polyangiaceae bacterium]|jgi:8-amino-7-oxononanoate synthase|nr:8-amino-7-oxononanoate synthase [Polyangiaceae bacterium]